MANRLSLESPRLTHGKKVFASLILFEIPPPLTPPPKGGVLVLTFAFVPLPPRSRTLPRSLARTFC